MFVTATISSAPAHRTTIVVLAAYCAACLFAAGCTGHGAATDQAEQSKHHEHSDHEGHAHEHDEHGHGHDATAGHEHDEEDVAITEADVDMPRDYQSAVARLAAYRQQILSALAEGHPPRAHRPLDEVDIVITKLMLLARDSGVPRRDWEEVNLARRDLRAQFDLAHAALGDGRSVDRAELEQATVSPLARLTAVATRLPKTADTTDTEKQVAAPGAEAQP
ncbi:MAG TPA: hypothetical protein VHD36_08075 [Pirellulales bacterium]|nr:hypothetical protein [Pirellulales bacterium]